MNKKMMKMLKEYNKNNSKMCLTKSKNKTNIQQRIKAKIEDSTQIENIRTFGKKEKTIKKNSKIVRKDESFFHQ
jgi:hypothetical protein